MLGDKIGRAKTMMITILVYSLFTGLSALSVGFWDFALYRFLTGLGVGGEFAVGVALVAEVMPDYARSRALGWLQALSAVGNIGGALIGTFLGILQSRGAISFDSWRIMFVIGALPALLAVVIRARLKEPERWQKTAGVTPGSDEATAHPSAGAPPKVQKLGSFSELFGDPRWRKNVIIGMLLASSGILGLWGIGFFSPRLVRLVFRGFYDNQGLSDEALKGKLLTLSRLRLRLSADRRLLRHLRLLPGHRAHRPQARLRHVLRAGDGRDGRHLLVPGPGRRLSGALVMLFVMGFCQLSLFGGYAIYFPELFPTRLRSTGTSFCYNVARYVAATGSFTLGWLDKNVFSDFASEADPSLAMRYACVTMCGVFLIGLVTIPFAPETRGQPLPE